MAASQTYRFGNLDIAVAESVRDKTPVFEVRVAPSYSLTLALDCKTNWAAIGRAHDLDWRVYATIRPDLDAFIARNRDRLVTLAEDPSCSQDNAVAIGDVVRSGSFQELLTDARNGPEEEILARTRTQWLADKIPLVIPHSAHAPAPIRKHALIVTHASYLFGGNAAIKPAVDILIREFKAAGRPVIYLMNEDHVADAAWMTDDRTPDLALESKSGEHNLDIRTSEITSVGGFRELCEAETVTQAARSFFSGGGTGVFTVNFPMAATYSEKMAYRLPGVDTEAFPALIPLTHYPSLLEAFSILGERDFTATLGPSVFMSEDQYHVQLFLDGKPVGDVGHGAHAVAFKYWTNQP